jgi:hypothetical protein
VIAVQSYFVTSFYADLYFDQMEEISTAKDEKSKKNMAVNMALSPTSTKLVLVTANSKIPRRVFPMNISCISL